MTANVDTTWAAYPSLGGYDAWIGTCSPLVSHADSEPGNSPRALVQLSPVTVHLYAQNTGDSAKTQGRSVSLTWSPTSSCTETLSYTATTDTGCSPNTAQHEQPVPAQARRPAGHLELQDRRPDVQHDGDHRDPHRPHRHDQRDMTGRRRPRGEDGTTLAEMLVALIVFSVFATFLATTVLQTTRLARTSALREGAAQSASLVMQQLSKDVRTAIRLGPSTAPQVAFLTATPSEVVFYANVEPAILRVRLYVSGGELFRETKVPDVGSTFPDLTYASTDPTRTTTRRLASTNLQTAGLFTYYREEQPDGAAHDRRRRPS